MEVPEKPVGGRKFELETTRWRMIRDGLMAVSDMLPRSAYHLHTALMELYATAERERERAARMEVRSEPMLPFTEEQSWTRR